MGRGATAMYDRAPMAAEDRAIFLKRWLWVWVLLLTVVVLVVIAYLIPINLSLASINKNLSPTERSVSGAGADLQRLPDDVQKINADLDPIEKALRPLNPPGAERGRLDDIIAALEPIDAKLSGTTAPRLSNTAGMLVTVNGQVTDIRNTVVSAQTPGSAGTQLIWQQLLGTNATLDAAVRDLDNIIVGLRTTNPHLVSACNKAGPGTC